MANKMDNKKIVLIIIAIIGIYLFLNAKPNEVTSGNREGDINTFYEGTGNFLTSLGTTWQNMNEYTRFLVGGMGLIFLTILLVFKEPRVRK